MARKKTPTDVERARGAMPSPQEMFQACVASLGYKAKNQAWFRENFTVVAKALMDRGQELLEAEQDKAWESLEGSFTGKTARDRRRRCRDIELSFGNQRKKRAGVHFELVVQWLLEQSGIPSEDGQPETGRSDRVIPDLKTYHDHPERCVILEYKRTTRERWKEIRDEISRSGQAVWFLTLEEKLPASLVETIAESKITLYVLPGVYAKLAEAKAKVRGRLRSMDFLIEDILHVVVRHPQRRLNSHAE